GKVQTCRPTRSRTRSSVRSRPPLDRQYSFVYLPAVTRHTQPVVGFSLLLLACGTDRSATHVPEPQREAAAPPADAAVPELREAAAPVGVRPPEDASTP